MIGKQTKEGNAKWSWRDGWEKYHAEVADTMQIYILSQTVRTSIKKRR